MSTKKEIKSRSEVFELVNTFYARIRKDDFLGPIFNKMLATEEIWVEHLEKLTDFWETNLFAVMKFKGNPMAAHQKVDKAFNHSITQDHFYEWLKLWNSTVDSLFEGEKAKLAKERARRMSTHLHINMWQNKPENLLDA
ncbi:group III truncated hemoglobin [Flavobacteriales bacterium]|nr:group III truncated hemoglobin [Flavobacteriales bacterium]